MPFTGKRSKYRQEAVDEFMAKFPNMTYTEIRRHRIDYFKALCLELEEDGYTDASKEIQRLIDFEESQRHAAEQNSIILARPFLKDQHSMLEALQKGLRQAEKEKVSVKNEKKAISLLETVQNTSIGRIWLLPNLEPVDIAKDGETVQDDIWARELEAKAGEAGTIYEETCAFLNKIYFKMAKKLRDQGQNTYLDDAIELCRKSLKNAKTSRRVHLMAEALKELGLCHMEKEDFHSAQSYFEELLTVSSQNRLRTAVCEAHQQLGHVYE
ncbi:hypothetical protein J437_LFUL001999, partial [Ladona fulva]